MIYRFIVLTFEHVLQLQTISAQHESFENYRRYLQQYAKLYKHKNIKRNFAQFKQRKI